jgi:hypothetical protein
MSTRPLSVGERHRPLVVSDDHQIRGSGRGSLESARAFERPQHADNTDLTLDETRANPASSATDLLPTVLAQKMLSDSHFGCLARLRLFSSTGAHDVNTIEKSLVSLNEQTRQLEIRKCAGGKLVDGPVRLVFDAPGPGIVREVASDSMTHPDRQLQRVVYVGDVAAEQKTGYEIIGRVVSPRPVGGEIVVVQQAFIDLLRTRVFCRK